ncbi:hypothetical protein GGS23DRAFT_577579 [Durotheca rogersii]|uniref:uncharacterized protein n=1 Tax=Durotheca rogersii TaxID=419775 RepID=UPI002220367F|nr:uncharacterized protein GGS23DRAFT_577579 [Durotheca rogersii]KAI5861208.1 hypothetical protein GGS23DRAFT_577579 [Durotheca rogersii]
MGQDFDIAAPHSRLYMRGSRFGEILFDGSMDSLVDLLAVPVRPVLSPISGRGASTSAEARDTHVGEHPKRKADGEVHADCPRHHKLAKVKSSGREGEANADRPVTISHLPVEILLEIFAQVELVPDLVCLGLANRRLWAIARECLHDYYQSFLRQWAGKRIVCVGEYTKPGDYPPGLFSEEEVQELGQTTLGQLYNGQLCDDLEYIDPNEPVTLAHFTWDYVSGIERSYGHDLYLESTNIFIACQERDPRDPGLKLACKDIRIPDTDFYPKDQRWILRNLTTKEFVRSESIAIKPELIYGPTIYGIGFGEVLLSRICWSSDDFLAMDPKISSRIYRGVWAGHRFDITTVTKHRDETEGEPWSDVSEEVAKEIAEIWESEFGPKWREVVCKEARGGPW